MSEQTPTPLAENPKNGETPPDNQADSKPLHARPIIIIGIILGVLLLAVLCFGIGGFTASAIQFFITTLFSFLILIVIAFQADIYERQWKAMNEGLQQTSEQFYIAERAYIAVTGIGINRVDIERGKKPCVRMKVRNGGRTPAFDVSANIRYVLGALDNPRTIHTDPGVRNQIQHTLTQAQRIICPLGQYVLPGEDARHNHEVDESYDDGGIFARTWKEGRAWVYVAVEVTYFDFRGIAKRQDADRRTISYEVFFTKTGQEMAECTPDQHDAHEKPN